MKDKFWILDMPKYSMIIFILFNIIAMFLYPGGNINEQEQIGYSFIRNFFSDLGMTVSHSDENNLGSCIFFNLSLCFIGVCFCMLFYKVKNIFTNYKILSLLATLLGVLSGLSFIGVAFTPSDIYLDINNTPWLHIIFAHWIFRFLFATSVLYSILIFKTEGFDNKYAYGFIIFGFMVLMYVYVSEAYLRDPRLFPGDLVKHVVAQKMIVFWILFSIYIYSIGLGKYLNKKI